MCEERLVEEDKDQTPGDHRQDGRALAPPVLGSPDRGHEPRDGREGEAAQRDEEDRGTSTDSRSEDVSGTAPNPESPFPQVAGGAEVGDNRDDGGGGGGGDGVDVGPDRSPDGPQGNEHRGKERSREQLQHERGSTENPGGEGPLGPLRDGDGGNRDGRNDERDGRDIPADHRGALTDGGGHEEEPGADQTGLAPSDLAHQRPGGDRTPQRREEHQDADGGVAPVEQPVRALEEGKEERGLAGEDVLPELGATGERSSAGEVDGLVELGRWRADAAAEHEGSGRDEDQQSQDLESGRRPVPSNELVHRASRYQARALSLAITAIAKARSPSSRWGQAILAGISLALIVGLILVTDVETLGTALERGALTAVGIAVALYLINTVLKTFRWWILLRAAGVRPTFGRAYSSFLVGMAVNNLLPTGLAGEPVRLLGVEGKITSKGAGSVTADRALDAVFIIAVAAAGVPLLVGVNPDAVAPTIAAVAIVALGVLLLAALVWRRWGLDTLAKTPATGASAAALTIPIQANDAIRLTILAAAYGVELSGWRALVIVAIGTLAGIIAVLGGGAGIALTVSAMLGAVGADPETAVAIGLVFVATSTWLSYPLGALAALWRAQARRPAEERWTSRLFSRHGMRRKTSES